MSKIDDISRWVEQNGYPLEMRVALSLRGYDPLYVQQSHYEADSVTGKMREIDVLASWGYVSPDPDNDDDQHIFTDLVVECKDIPHSWVLFRDASSDFREIPRTVLALNAIPSRLPENPEPDGWEHQLFPIDDNIPRFLRGAYNPCYAIKQKSINQKKAEHSDPAYNAVCKIGEAAIDSVSKVLAGYHRTIPAIVTTADLFECFLEDSGAIRITEVERGSVLLNSPRHDEPVEVHILNESALPQFAEEIVELASRLTEEPEHRNRD